VTIRGAGQRCDVSNELPASGMLHRGGNAHLDAELVRPVRLALADALDLWRVSSAVSTAGAPNQSLNWAGIAASNLMILLLDMGEVPYTTNTSPPGSG
jgi:hypothetical protein